MYNGQISIYLLANADLPRGSSVSPHAVQWGSITYSFEEGVPDKLSSDRANVSPGGLDQHYDPA